MNNNVETCALAPNLTISRVLTGLWQVADMERQGPVDLNAAAEAMQPYVDAGFTTFDMADHYGSAEDICGLFKSASNGTSPVQLLTKWVPEPQTRDPKEVRPAIERALKRLQSSHIDLLQFHAWNYADPSWLDLLFQLQVLKEEGLIKHLGLTNFDAVHLNMVLESGIAVVSNQVSFSLLDQRAAGEMAAVCAKHSVKLLAFGTLGGGFLSERWLGQPEPDADSLATWSQMKYLRFIQTAGGWGTYQKLLETVQEVATKHTVSMANIASRYILDHPAVGGVILGARLGQSEHIEENLRLFDTRLDEQDHKHIQSAIKALNVIPGGCGDEYRKPPFLTASGDLSHHMNALPAPYPAIEDAYNKRKVLSGTPWEGFAGYSRAVRKGNRILVSGTTATQGARCIGGTDPAAQAHFAIDKIEGAIQSLGGQLEDVIRTRIFISNMAHWEAIARAHGARFAHIQPANTLVQAGLIGEEYLVEIEAEAVVD